MEHDLGADRGRRTVVSIDDEFQAAPVGAEVGSLGGREEAEVVLLATQEQFRGAIAIEVGVEAAVGGSLKC